MPKKKCSAIDASRIDWLFTEEVPDGTPDNFHPFPGELKVIMGSLQRIAATTEAATQILFKNQQNDSADKERADMLEKKLKLLISMTSKRTMSVFKRQCKNLGYE